MWFTKYLRLFGILCIPFIGLGQSFDQVAQNIGLDHYHFMPGFMGGGIGVFDFNNDGWEDLYFTGGVNADKLYQNLGNGTFLDVSLYTGIHHSTRDKITFGVAIGDVNNDGCDDILVTTFDRDQRNILLINDCFGKFEDKTTDFKLFNRSASTGAVFTDVNKDGFLDVYVINYIDEFIFITDENGIITDIDRTCFPNYFYLNENGNGFVEKSQEYNVNNAGCGLALTATDFDMDSDQDIYVANDHGEFVVPNTMYINAYPQDMLSQASPDLGFDIGFYAMGIAQGDCNNDGFFDYYITNLGDNALLIYNPQTKQYDNLANNYDLANGFYNNGDHVVGWGANFFDAENDGDLDLFVSNGYIRAGYFDIYTRFEDTNKFFVNHSDGSWWQDSSEIMGANELDFVNRGSACFDYDKDGDLDLVVATASEDGLQKNLFYKNTTQNNNNWIKFSLEGSTSNKNAFGTIVRLYYQDKTLIRECHSGGSHVSQSSSILHFGIGEAAAIDSATIIWPSGAHQKILQAEINTHYLLIENDQSTNVLGCMDPSSVNYNPNATLNYGCYKELKFGCTNPSMTNYDPDATVNDGSCELNTSVIEPVFENIIIFPNPAKSMIYIESTSNTAIQRVSIFDELGREIMIHKTDLNSAGLQIDVDGLKNGLYILHIEIDKQVYSRKLIVMN